MAQSPKPLWKQLFDAVDGRLSPTINRVAGSEDVMTVAALGRRAVREAEQRLEQASRRTLHMFNMPAGSDVNRLLAHIANLEREVRDLRNQMADRENVAFLESLERRHLEGQEAEPRPARTPAKKAAKRPAPQPARRSAKRTG